MNQMMYFQSDNFQFSFFPETIKYKLSDKKKRNFEKGKYGHSRFVLSKRKIFLIDSLFMFS